MGCDFEGCWCFFIFFGFVARSRILGCPMNVVIVALGELDDDGDICMFQIPFFPYFLSFEFLFDL